MSEKFDWKKEINEEQLNIVNNCLKNDGLVIFPTETVYGLGANALSEDACLKIFEAKGRAQDNPLIVHVSDIKMLEELVEKPTNIEQKLIDSFMPGPFTIILRKKEKIPSVVSANMNTVGIRMPENKIAHKIIESSNIPIAAPSANISGRPSGTCLDDIYEELKDKVDVLIDGGQCKIGLESTVVKVENEIPVILRPGYVTAEQIKKVAGNVKISDNLFRKIEKDELVESPGMKYRHYAPKTKCVLVTGNEEEQIEKIKKEILENPDSCVLGFEEERNKICAKYFISLGSINNLEEVSRNIFSALRRIDTLPCSIAFVQSTAIEGLGLGIMNRLQRACENKKI